MANNLVSEIAHGVHRVAVGRGAFVGVFPPNVYFVMGDGAAAFIDTAYGRDEEVEAQIGLWESKGRPPVDGVILTHRHGDHIGGAARLSKATGAPIIASRAESKFIDDALEDASVTITVTDGDILKLGDVNLEFIDMPGHTLGSLGIYHKEQQLLFTGDNILGIGSTVILPEQGDLALYLDSLHRMSSRMDGPDYETKLICPGHGPMVDNPAAKIKGIIDHRFDRENQILSLLSDGCDTADCLFTSIYPELDSRLHNMARAQIRSHLMKLSREGKIEEHGERITLRLG